MGTGAVTQYIDLAQIVLYVFWIFFFWLVVWLVREGKREGYPLESDRRDYVDIQGWPAIPKAKQFRLGDGTILEAPHDRDRNAPALAARSLRAWRRSGGAPIGILQVSSTLPLRWRLLVIVGNAAWTLASIALLISGAVAPNGLGLSFVVMQAVVVGVFAELQYVGLKRSGAALAA